MLNIDVLTFLTLVLFFSVGVACGVMWKIVKDAEK